MGIQYLSLQVEWMRNLPPKPETPLTILITAAHWALSFAMYAAILLALSYAARRKYFAPMTVITVMVISLLFNFGISTALYHWQSIPPTQSAGVQMGGNGLILSNSMNKNETTVVLLKGTAEPLGPRVTAIPDRPMIFQESTANSNMILPPILFGDDTPWFFKSINIDIRLSEEQLQKRFDEGIHSYFIYAGALIFLLSSLGFAIKFSVWPLANLFMGIIAFRGILAVESFFNTPEMQEIFDSFFNNIIPTSLAVPLIFVSFGLLVNIYAVLVFISKRRGKDEY